MKTLQDKLKKAGEIAEAFRLSINVRCVLITVYDSYRLLDDTEIDFLMESLERDARKKKRKHLISLGCIDSGLL